MSRRYRLVAVAALLLALSGCVMADGIAHVVKLAEHSHQKDSGSPAPSQPAVRPASVPTDEGAAPEPLPAPRDSIKVEELSPPH